MALKKIYKLAAEAAVLITALMSVACSSAPVPMIRGNVAGLEDGAVYLHVYGTRMRCLDSTHSKSGLFEMPLPEIIPDALLLEFENHPGRYIPLIAEGHDIRIAGGVGGHDDVTAEGSPSNDALKSYRNSIRGLDVTLRAIDLAAEEMQNGDTAGLRTLGAKRDSIERLLAASRSDFVRQNPAGIVSAMFVLGAADEVTSRGGLDSLLGQLDTVAMPDNAFLRRLRRRIDNTPATSGNNPL